MRSLQDITETFDLFWKAHWRLVHQGVFEAATDVQREDMLSHGWASPDIFDAKIPDWIKELEPAEVIGIRRGLGWVLGGEWDDPLDT